MCIDVPNWIYNISEVDADDRPLGVRAEFDGAPAAYGCSLLADVGDSEAVLACVAFVSVAEVYVEVEVLARWQQHLHLHQFAYLVQRLLFLVGRDLYLVFGLGCAANLNSLTTD